MKNIPFVLILACLDFSIQLNGQTTTFYKTYGDANDNFPLKVKGFNGHTYVLSAKKDAMTEYAVFSKFTNGGVLVWEKQLDIPSQLLDFEYTGTTDNSFLLVGHTEPTTSGGVPQDNESLLVKIDDSGNLVMSEEYMHTGREGFSRIIRHTAALPSGTIFEFYVVGHKNLTVPANTTDQPMLYNFDNNGIARFGREYNYAFELEARYGMFQKSNGNVVLLGAAAPNNDGVLVEVDGVTGAVVSGNKYNNTSNTGYDFWDGMQLPPASGDQIVIGGTDFGPGKGFLLTLNSSYDPVFGTVFDNISEVREIGRQNANILYILGPAKQVPDYPIVARISTNYSAFTVIPSNVNYLRRFENDFKNPHFSVTPGAQRIFYADSREVVPGNFDMLVGALTLNFNVQNPVNDCHELFTLNTTPFTPVRTAITVTDATLTQSILPVGVLIPPVYASTNFCPPNTCSASFMLTFGNCQEVNFSGMGTSNGAGPITYSWTFGNGTPSTSSNQNETVTYTTPGTYNVCLTITDASINCSNTNCQNVTVPAASPPYCVSPADVFISTDQGQCYTFFAPAFSLYGCPPLTMSVVLTGATTGTVLATNYNKGVTTVTVTVTDGFNNTTTCSTNVNVIDNEPPVIICPPDQSKTAPFCDGGAIVHYPPPTVTDNCPMVSYICSHPSGSFFPCGPTTVTCIATDMSNNTSSCTFNVNVDCQCASIGTPTIACDPLIDDKYLFTIPVTVLNGATNCVVSVSGTGQPGVTVMANNLPGSGVLSGMITVTGGIVPTTLDLVVSVQCVCPGGGTSNCTFPVSLVPICCKHISLNDQSVCATAQTATLPIIGCGQFLSVKRLDYWVASGPGQCPPFPGPGWSVQQSGTTCAPLLFLPYLYTDNLWVKAIIEVCDYPCSIIESNIATITLCQPVSCTIGPMLDEHCYSGTPITAATLTVTGSGAGPNCPGLGITWSGPGVPAGTTGPSYTPTNLVPSSTTVCYEDFVFTATIQSICGTQTCSATVRIFNDAASIGSLVMNPFETPIPYCPGEDFTLQFNDNCVSRPPAPGMWYWCISNDGVNYSPLLGTNSGDMNPLWNTNQLYQDTWYKVKAENGVCPQKEVVYFIDLLDPFSIGTFTAIPNAPTPACFTNSLDLSVPFSPTPAPTNCLTKVTWIKDGQVLHMDFYTTSPATWSYADPSLLGDYSGNYWCIVERTCCGETFQSNVVTIDPPCEAGIIAPCFRCNNQPVTLIGVVSNVPANVICTYQWCKNGTPIPGATGLSINVNMGNALYTFKVNCNGCIKTVDYYLLQCGSNPNCTHYYRDFDADTYGDVNNSIFNCGPPAGYVADGTDCDDNNAAINPAATEICNGLDDDCSGASESLLNIWTGLGDNLNWSDPANWIDYAVPLTCQGVVIPGAKTVVVPAAFHGVGKTLDVAKTSTLTVQPPGTLTIQQ